MSSLIDDVLVCPGYEHAVRWRPGERFHHLFEDRCDRLREQGDGNRLAVDAGEVKLTFDELDRRANQLARHLLACGARPGDRIALLFDRAVHSYVGMLAVLKIHAAYVPLDVGFPADRLSYIVQDAGVRMVLTLSHVRDRLEVPATLVCVDEVAALVEAEDDGRLTDTETGSPADELCYIIYTSGSTGRPKGVAIEHASICNFVRVAVEVYGIEPRDRVYQGMTIAFDFSVEEIWVPLLAGATLVPKPDGSTLLGRELREYLVDNDITALCCVPTLLATLDEDVPRLRFLLVSGEACPQDLVTRWHRPGRRFLNVYGPTEATVTATWALVDPSRPVTLGVPLPTYSAIILDPTQDKALPHGEMGEIGIAGIGLATGYVNRNDLTERAFIRDFLGIAENPSARIYRTGDLGRINADGEIEYHGRIDTQVKIRGYRIELTEIESVLLQVPGIAQAVVDTYEPDSGMTELVGYYSLRGDTTSVDTDDVYARLRERLPAYMVPAYLEELAAIPMLPSDKADRKNLPPPKGPRSRATQHHPYVAPSTDAEKILADALAAVLHLDRVSADSHFFNDLDANSLLMAHFCARVRDTGDLPPVSMRDVYLHPTVRDLASALTEVPEASAAADAPETPQQAPPPGSTRQYVACGALQFLIFLGYIYGTALIMAGGYEWVIAGAGILDLYLRSVMFGAASFLGLGIAPVVAKWVIIGRWKPREFPVWSLTYVAFWTVKTLIRSSPFVVFVGSPLYVLYLRALGAKVGRGVTILSPAVPVCTDLLTIGDDTVIRKDSSFTCYRAHAGMIQTGRVTVGKDVFIGEKTVLDIDTSLGDGAQLGHASSFHAGQAVPEGAHWHGSPAQPTDADYRTVEPAPCSTVRRVTYSALQLLRVLVLYLPAGLFTLSVLLPEILSSGHVALGRWTFYRDVLGISFVLFFLPVLTGLAFVLTVPRLLNRFLRPDTVYPLYGFHYAVQRTIARMTNAKFYTDLFGDSSYIVSYLRALGYKLDPVEQTGSNFGTELQHESPYLTSVGTGTMVSDALSIMNAEYSSTSFRLSQVSIGERNYLGNNLAFPPGARTGDNCLLGTKAMVPIDGPVRVDVGLLGSPCFEIPRSVQRDSEFDHLKDQEERRRRLAAKNRHNVVTMGMSVLVQWLLSFFVLVLASVAADNYDEYGPFAVAGGLLGILVFSIAYSGLIERAVTRFGRLSPQFCSIYDPYFWWHERLWKLVASAPFSGTPFKNVVWRLLGVRVGRRVFDDGCGIPEKTLVTIGDDCTINAGSVIQCHSLEDGAFKSDYTTIGAGCTLGVESFVHYGVTMGDGAVLEADSFLMKGEVVAPHSRWGGNPATEIRASAPVSPVTPAHPTAAEVAAAGAVPASAASLLEELRATPAPQLTRASGVALSLFSQDACARREAELVALLGAEELEEARSIRSDERRSTFVSSRALVRLLLSEWQRDVGPAEWLLGRSDLGKLTILGPVDTGIDLSISHTRDVIAVAISEVYDVGVDVEPAVAPDWDPVVWSMLWPSEQALLAATPASERPSQFLRMWTLKEAFVKCSGAGVALSFDRVHTSFRPLDVVLDGGDHDPETRYRFHQEEWRLGDEPYWVAVAVGNRPPSGPTVDDVYPHDQRRRATAIADGRTDAGAGTATRAPGRRSVMSSDPRRRHQQLRHDRQSLAARDPDFRLGRHGGQ